MDPKAPKLRLSPSSGCGIRTRFCSRLRGRTDGPRRDELPSLAVMMPPESTTDVRCEVTPPGPRVSVADSAPGTRPAPPLPARVETVWVALGGAFGALLRALVAAELEVSVEQLSLATFVVNGVGAALLGALLAGFELRGPQPRTRALLAVGALGSFTTYSTLVDESLRTALASRPTTAVLGLVLSIGIGLLAFDGAERATKRMLARSRERAPGERAR